MTQTSIGGVRRAAGYLGDAALLLALVWLLPLVILVIGAPIALLGRLLFEIGQRF